jgi:hypothetical protein
MWKNHLKRLGAREVHLTDGSIVRVRATDPPTFPLATHPQRRAPVHRHCNVAAPPRCPLPTTAETAGRSAIATSTNTIPAVRVCDGALLLSHENEWRAPTTPGGRGGAALRHRHGGAEDLPGEGAGAAARVGEQQRCRYAGQNKELRLRGQDRPGTNCAHAHIDTRTHACKHMRACPPSRGRVRACMCAQVRTCAGVSVARTRHFREGECARAEAGGVIVFVVVIVAVSWGHATAT